MTLFIVLVQSLAKLIQSTSSQSVSERPILILSPHIFLVAPFLHLSFTFPSRFSPKSCRHLFCSGEVMSVRCTQEQRCNRRQNKKKERMTKKEIRNKFCFIRTVPVGCQENLQMIEPLRDSFCCTHQEPDVAEHSGTCVIHALRAVLCCALGLQRQCGGRREAEGGSLDQLAPTHGTVCCDISRWQQGTEQVSSRVPQVLSQGNRLRRTRSAEKVACTG
jgi:hypothetical protein